MALVPLLLGAGAVSHGLGYDPLELFDQDLAQRNQAERDEIERTPGALRKGLLHQLINSRVSPMEAMDRQAVYDYQRLREGQDTMAAPDELAEKALAASQAEAAQAASLAAQAGRQQLAAPQGGEAQAGFRDYMQSIIDGQDDYFGAAYADQVAAEQQQIFQEEQMIRQRALQAAMSEQERARYQAEMAANYLLEAVSIGTEVVGALQDNAGTAVSMAGAGA